MNKETLNKLKELTAAKNDFASGEPAYRMWAELLLACGDELIALAERTTSPVSQMTDEQQRQVEKCLRDGAIMGSVSDSTVDAVRAILAAAAPHAQARYEWLANRVLACDYGDNDKPGQIGWRIRHNLLPTNGGRQPAFMYGKSIDEAIDAAMKENP